MGPDHADPSLLLIKAFGGGVGPLLDNALRLGPCVDWATAGLAVVPLMILASVAEERESCETSDWSLEVDIVEEEEEEEDAVDLAWFRPCALLCP